MSRLTHACDSECLTSNESDWQFHGITVAFFEPIDDIEAKSEKFSRPSVNLNNMCQTGSVGSRCVFDLLIKIMVNSFKSLPPCLHTLNNERTNWSFYAPRNNRRRASFSTMPIIDRLPSKGTFCVHSPRFSFALNRSLSCSYGVCSDRCEKVTIGTITVRAATQIAMECT